MPRTRHSSSRIPPRRAKPNISDQLLTQCIVQPALDFISHELQALGPHRTPGGNNESALAQEAGMSIPCHLATNNLFPNQGDPCLGVVPLQRRVPQEIPQPFETILLHHSPGSPPSPLELNSLRLRQVHVSKIPGFRSRHDRLPILQKYIHDRVASTAVQLTHHVIQEQQGIALVVLQTPSALSQEKSQNRRSLFPLGAHSTQVKLIKVKPDVVSMRTQIGETTGPVSPSIVMELLNVIVRPERRRVCPVGQ